jgi:broad-specificity NMP kinase
MLIILTGVPGTGKTYFSLILKNLGYKIVNINDFVEKNRIFIEKNNEKIVNIKALDEKLTKEIKKLTKDKIVIEGHLACELKKINSLKPSLCIVLRKNPLLLKKILEKRKYNERKIKDNLECELIDYCGIKSKENIKCPIYELDVDDKKEVGKLIKLFKENKTKILKDKYIDWMEYYLKKKNKKKKFENFIEWLVK